MDKVAMYKEEILKIASTALTRRIKELSLSGKPEAVDKIKNIVKRVSSADRYSIAPNRINPSTLGKGIHGKLKPPNDPKKWRSVKDGFMPERLYYRKLLGKGAVSGRYYKNHYNWSDPWRGSQFGSLQREMNKRIAEKKDWLRQISGQ